MATDLNEQYLRTCKLIVYGNNSNGLDLSNLRIKFSVKRSDSATPNTGDFRVYNLSDDTAIQIRKEFTRVVFEAGYEGNSGIIFQGNIKQVIIGRESATDTFIDIVAGDGDRAYNHAIVQTTLAKGSMLSDQVAAAAKATAPNGVTQGYTGDLGNTVLPRGKVMYGQARNYLHNVAKTSKASWSIQDEKIVFVNQKSYLPGTAAVLSSSTGLIGTPQQTNEGVNIKCLLNPKINISGRVQLKDAIIAQQKLDLNQLALAKGDVSTINKLFPRRLNTDGMYYVLVLEHSGDTRGVEWYTSMVCLNVDVSANARNSVQGGFG